MIVVLAAKGYPGAYAKGDVIGIPESLPDGVHLIHAGTKRSGDQIVSAGGRVLGAVAIAPALARAAKNTYAACEQIVWENKVYRRDIGHHQLNS